jgi:hypothetical protein
MAARAARRQALDRIRVSTGQAGNGMVQFF